MAADHSRRSAIRGVLALVSGTTLAQAVLVAASPVLTRLFTPEDFAVLALFTALVQVLGAVANGRYELAVVLPADHGEAWRLAVTGVAVAAVLSVLLLLAAALFRAEVAAIWNLPALAPWLFLLPVAVFFGAVFAAAQAFAVRLGNYRAIAGATILKALLQCAVQIGTGLAAAGAGGLVIGRTLANVFANGRLIRSGLAAVGGWQPASLAEMLRLARLYRRFPLYSGPAGLLNVFNANLTTFALPILLSATALGHYALAMRVLGAPLAQIAGPIGQVYTRTAAEELRRTGRARRSFLRTLAVLSAISVAVFLPLAFLAEPLFALVFGADWAVAGRYAEILMPFLAVRFVVSPLSQTAVLTDNRFGLAFNLLVLVATAAVLWAAQRAGWSAEGLFSVLSATLGGCYLAYLPPLYALAAHRNASRKGAE